MQLFAHMPAARHRVKKLVRCVLGLAGHEADPVLAGNGVDRGEKVGKVIGRIKVFAVAVDILPEQRDLLIALGNQLTALGDDLLRLLSRPRT